MKKKEMCYISSGLIPYATVATKKKKENKRKKESFTPGQTNTHGGMK